jgi:hypothetical protein
MRTFVFVLFVVVTASVAITGTIVAMRYLALERQLTEVNGQLESAQRDRVRQEEEKMALRLERERLLSEMEAKLAETRGQLDLCSGQYQRDLREVLAGQSILQRQLSDAMARQAPSAVNEPPAAAEPPARAEDVHVGAIPTPEQERKRLEKVSP